jgi:oligopeptide/dipeptide ABC transporter ATP-binding protein
MNGPENPSPSLLAVRELTRAFASRRTVLGRPRGVVRAVTDVSFDLPAGQTLGIVGESGSGKSTLGRLALRMIEADSGDIRFDGRDLRGASPGELRRLRAAMTVIFQDPYSALDPRWTVGRSIGEPLRINGSTSAAGQREKIVEILDRVGLEPEVMNRLPRALSGGQRQRIVIARALVTRPRLVFCDEPVSGLDVSTRAQVLALLRDLQREFSVAYLFVSHDLGVVEAVSDRIAVMYLGSIVEVGSAEAVARQYRHPYTAALVSASPAPDPLAQRARSRVVLSGDPPSAVDVPSGCAFHPRCALAIAICADKKPELQIGADGHGVACHVTNADPSLSGMPLFARMTGASASPPTATAAPPGQERPHRHRAAAVPGDERNSE